MRYRRLKSLGRGIAALTMAGVLAIGMVPAVAFATDAPITIKDEMNDSIFFYLNKDNGNGGTKNGSADPTGGAALVDLDVPSSFVITVPRSFTFTPSEDDADSATSTVWSHVKANTKLDIIGSIKYNIDPTQTLYLRIPETRTINTHSANVEVRSKHGANTGTSTHGLYAYFNDKNSKKVDNTQLSGENYSKTNYREISVSGSTVYGSGNDSDVAETTFSGVIQTNEKIMAGDWHGTLDYSVEITPTNAGT